MDGLNKNSRPSIKTAHFVDGLMAAEHRGQKKRTKWTETT